ncbi:MAG TPA: CBS domain-containing protein, partial [Bryobacteraceae bacterium]|nr:CBS domain-containing protein [Bryobacteraceae bacterium]
DSERRIKGVVTRRQLHQIAESPDATASLGELLTQPVVAYPDEPLRVVVFRMAETGLTRLPVVDSQTGSLAGMISLHDLLMARVRNLNEERQRERVFKLRLPVRGFAKSKAT